MTPAQRESASSLRAELEARLAPASEREAGARFAALLLAFPAQATGEASAEASARARAAAYFEALADQPAWAISRACRRWLRGEGEGELAFANLAFAPSPPQLRRLCAAETRPVRAQAARLERLLAAAPEAEPHLPEERRAAMAARLSALARALGA